jgi:hypothetical protein
MTSLPAQVIAIEKRSDQYQGDCPNQHQVQRLSGAHDDSARGENLNPLVTNVIAIIIVGYSSF